MAVRKPPPVQLDLHQHDVIDSPSAWFTALVIDSSICCRLTTPRPAHLSAPAADSTVIDLSCTVVIINSAVDNFWPKYEVKSIQYIFYILFSLKEQLLWFAMLLRQDNCSLHQHDVVDSPVRAGLQRRGRLIRLSLAAWSTSTHRAAPVCMSCLLSMSKSLLG